MEENQNPLAINQIEKIEVVLNEVKEEIR